MGSGSLEAPCRGVGLRGGGRVAEGALWVGTAKLGGCLCLWCWSWWQNWVHIQFCRQSKILFICGTWLTSEGEPSPFNGALKMWIRAKEFLGKLGGWPPHLTSEKVEAQKGEGPCLWHKWNWSLLSLMSGQGPSHQTILAAEGTMFWGGDTAYSC